MSKPKHTPGPWQSDAGLVYVHNGAIADVHCPADDWPTGDQLLYMQIQNANAQLIAAAPDLLAVVEEYIAFQLFPSQLLDKALDAIVKARGEAA